MSPCWNSADPSAPRAAAMARVLPAVRAKARLSRSRASAAAGSPCSPAISPAQRKAGILSSAGAASAPACVRNVSSQARPSVLALRSRQNPPSAAARRSPAALSSRSRNQASADRKLASSAASSPSDTPGDAPARAAPPVCAKER